MSDEHKDQDKDREVTDPIEERATRLIDQLQEAGCPIGETVGSPGWKRKPWRPKP